MPAMPGYRLVVADGARIHLSRRGTRDHWYGVTSFGDYYAFRSGSRWYISSDVDRERIDVDLRGLHGPYQSLAQAALVMRRELRAA